MPRIFLLDLGFCNFFSTEPSFRSNEIWTKYKWTLHVQQYKISFSFLDSAHWCNWHLVFVLFCHLSGWLSRVHQDKHIRLLPLPIHNAKSVIQVQQDCLFCLLPCVNVEIDDGASLQNRMSQSGIGWWQKLRTSHENVKSDTKCIPFELILFNKQLSSNWH